MKNNQWHQYLFPAADLGHFSKQMTLPLPLIVEHIPSDNTSILM
jgi:hypothetical protein